MYLVELHSKKDDYDILGNLDGQGFHELKTVRGVLNRLKNAKPLNAYRNNNYEYVIKRGYDWLHCDKIVYRIDVCDIIK